MDRTDLSSNWKKLQQMLQKEKQEKPKKEQDRYKDNKSSRSKFHSHSPPSQFLKRKAHPATIPSSALPPKRRKTLYDSYARMADTHTTSVEASPSDLAALLSSPSDHDFLSSPSHPFDATLLNYGPSPPSLLDAHLGKYLSLDCEMVGTAHPPSRDISTLARVSLVSYTGCQIYDSFVYPSHGPSDPSNPSGRVEVTDWRTPYSGITAELLETAPHGGARTFETAQAEVRGLLQNRIIIGHAVHNDLEALGLEKEAEVGGWEIRDTSRYSKFRAMTIAQDGKGKRERGKIRTPGLRMLARRVLGWEIQSGEHSSVEDARAAMRLFQGERVGMEREFGGRRAAEMRKKGVNIRGGARARVVGLGVEEMEEEDGDEDVEGSEEDESDGGVIVNTQQDGKTRKRKKKKKKGKYR